MEKQQLDVIIANLAFFANKTLTGTVGLVVAMSVLAGYIYIYMSPSHVIFLGLSLALRSHDQFEASHWSTLLPYRTPHFSGLSTFSGFSTF